MYKSSPVIVDLDSYNENGQEVIVVDDDKLSVLKLDGDIFWEKMIILQDLR